MAPRRRHGIIEHCRGVALLLVMIVGGLMITSISLILYPLAYLLDRNGSMIHRFTAASVKYLLRPFIPRVRVIGREHLNQLTTPRAVMVANHQSTLDSFIFGDLWSTNFRVTFKQELLWYPGIGTTMWLAGYVPVRRGDKESAARMMSTCEALLRDKIWVLFFPEGTRKIDGSTGPMGPFKAGAFKLALEANVPIVPITISGARGLMPARGYPSLGFGEPKLIVHPPLQTEGKTVEQLMAECYAVIASAMGPEDIIQPTPTASTSTTTPLDKKAE